MKTLILLSAGESPAEIIGRLPSLGALTDTYYPGTLRVDGQSGSSYALVFSRYASAWGKSFYVCAAKTDPDDAPDAGFPSYMQGIDCLILDLTAENADFTETDAKLRDLLANLMESGEVCRLLLLDTTVIPAQIVENFTLESEDGPLPGDFPEDIRDAESTAAPTLPSAAELPFLIYDGSAPMDIVKAQSVIPADPVDFDTLCRLLFTDVEVTDLDSLYEEDDSEKANEEKKEKRSLFASIFDWVEIFCVALVGVILLMTFFVRRSPVEGSSMYPTLIGHNASAMGTVDPEHGVEKGYDDLLISNLLYSPHRQDIVIIQEPTQLSEPIVKRIIGIGGDRIKIDFEHWEVYVNDELLDEPYVNKKDYSMGSQLLKADENNCWEGTVPEGCIFVLGDNRAISKDSRSFGFIDQRYIIGKVIFRISPLDRFGKVED